MLYFFIQKRKILKKSYRTKFYKSIKIPVEQLEKKRIELNGT